MRFILFSLKKCVSDAMSKMVPAPAPAAEPTASESAEAEDGAQDPGPSSQSQSCLLRLLTEDELELILVALPLVNVSPVGGVCRRFRAMIPSILRLGHLRTIQHCIGAPPRNADGTLRRWEQEWTDIKVEQFRLGSQRQFANRDYVEKHSTVQHLKDRFKRSIGDMVQFGWPRERAETVALLTTGNAALGRALRAGDPCYGAAMYAISNGLFLQRQKQSILPNTMYSHLRGKHSLIELDAGWKTIEQPDHTGFRGLLSCSVTNCTRVQKNFTEEGYALYINRDGKGTFDPIDSEVVAFESHPDDRHGCHMAILGAHSNSARFPPLTLFEYQYSVEPGKWEAPGGIFPKQKLIVVRATYRPVTPTLLEDKPAVSETPAGASHTPGSSAAHSAVA